MRLIFYDFYPKCPNERVRLEKHIIRVRGRSEISKFHTKFKNILRLRISYAILIKKSVHSFSETELNIFVMLRA